MPTPTFIYTAAATATTDFDFWAPEGVGTSAVTSPTPKYNTYILGLDGTGTRRSRVFVNGVLADAGRRFTGWFQWTGTPDIGDPGQLITYLSKAAGNEVARINMNATTHILAFTLSGVTHAGTTALSSGTWYRISWAFVITDADHYTFNLWLNGTLEVTVTNADTLPNTGIDTVFLGNDIASATAFNCFWDGVYIDDGTTLDDPGDYRCTPKLPISDGTLTDFTVHGTGSGVGTGDAPYLNNRPSDTGDYTDVVIAGVAKTEEVNVQSLAAGDVDISAKTILGAVGWVIAKSASSETASVILNGATTNAALTSSSAFFPSAIGASFTPGTGADVGLTTSTDATTVTLYDCGVIFAYNNTVAAPPVDTTVWTAFRL